MAAVVTALVVVLTLLFLTALYDAAPPRPDVLVVDFSAVPDIDITALDELPAFVANGRERGITLWLANINARPLDMIRRLPDADRGSRSSFEASTTTPRRTQRERVPRSLRGIPPAKGDECFRDPAESW